VATDWTIVGDGPEEGFSEWTVDDLSSLDSKTERQAWSVKPTALGISAKAEADSAATTWGNWAAEDFRFDPEEVDVNPELTQGDSNEWTISPEAD
jgi:hypothetical protein